MESIHPYYNAFELRFYAETEDYDTASLNERIGLLQKALESLDYRGRELLFLKFDSGLNYNEIGELLNMKPDTVKKRVYRIIQYLRDNYSSKILDLLFIFASRN
jgi:RNA polymerase sigma-70 factor (ECF subfamily)